MRVEDIKDLLLGKAIRYSKQSNKDFKYYELVNAIDIIVENNIQYASYNMDAMLEDLAKYMEK